eukprot:4461330-Amphidinium_carterae.1
MAQVLLLWDSILLRLPQFPLFIGACLVHCFRETILGTNDDTQMSYFLASVAPLVDIGLLLQASLALFQAVPASVTLPLYPRYSAGDAIVSGPGSCATATSTGATLAAQQAHRESHVLDGMDDVQREENEKLASRAME